MAANDPLFSSLKSFLDSIGLGALATLGPNGEPAGWLWDQMRQGFDTSDELMINLQQTDIFKNRFGAIVEQERRAAAGLPQYVMTPAEVLQYEKTVTEMMTAAGMPSWFYDQPEDFQSLILNNMSTKEVEDRIVQSYEYVRNAPIEVRQKFEEFYGVGQGDAALAAYVLDPSRTTGALEQARRSAYTAGLAERFDMSISRQMAERVAQLPRTEAGIVEGLQNVNAQRGLYDESPFEATDLTADQGLAAQFEGDAGAIDAIQRRQIERSAAQRAATGGAIITNRGLTGAGTARGG